MKFYGSIVALCAISSAAAFQAPAPKAASSTALKSTFLESPGMRTGAGSYYAEPGGSMVGSYSRQEGLSNAQLIDEANAVIVQGGSLQTWSFANHNVERVQVLMNTEGRPLNANVDLWQGPDNTPQKMGVYIEDGNLRPFNCVIETPRGQNAIAIRNTGQMEFPLAASVEADLGDGSIMTGRILAQQSKPETIQGGAIKTYSFAPSVGSVQVLLQTQGRPLNARLELLQGPNNNKQVIELYTEDGTERPFFAIIETPGSGNVVRILNTAPVEFPLTACVEPYLVEPGNVGMGGYASDGSRSLFR